MQIKQSAIVLAILFGSASSHLVQKHHHRHHPSVHHGQKKDIAETHIDPWVFDKAQPNVDRLTLGRPDAPPKRSTYTPPKEPIQPGQKETPEGATPNVIGEANLFSKPVQVRRNQKDIAETHIDPWVFDKAQPNVDRLTNPRPDAPPKRSSYTPPQDPIQPGQKETPEGAAPEIIGMNNLAQDATNSPYVDPVYSKKFDKDGQYTPVWVEDFTDSTKFDNGVGGGTDQDNQAFPKSQTPYDVNGGSNPAYSLSQKRYDWAPWQKENPVQWADIQSQYKMDEPDWPRMESAWENNGGQAGWNKLYQTKPTSEFQNDQNRMKLDMDDFMRDKNDRIKASLKPKSDPMSEAIANTPIESLHQHQHHKHQHHQPQYAPFSLHQKRVKDMNIGGMDQDDYVFQFARDYDVKPPGWQGQIGTYFD